ncbi:hypothetical protein [Agrobacterium tumefaciens]|uniref:hypothetical protein n=1 Tax=Agrobacterium tumefaciens TaxID=358 RepID=UPI002243970E|nr:hypothetical protein [Agrobacterium tumefaciens]MCW8061196.1 hypothetical protein [Agrobacterium tumefaciens]MCW8146047.1 hypothetical protein [Agrobacterium tumefaciens]
MPDDSLWKWLLNRGSQRLARILGRGKPVQVESSRLETLPNEPTNKIIAARNEKTVFEEPKHARTKNLIYAEAAVKHVEEKLFLGSTNRPIDALHGGTFSDKLGNSEVRGNLLGKFKADVAKNQPLGLSADAAVLWQADQAEAFGMGNCGEQATVAFKYLLHHTDAKEASILAVGDNHHLLVIGASRSELQSAQSRRGAFRLDEAPQLPEQTVFCDPWYHEWFPASEWPNRIRSVLRETQSAEVSASANMDDEEREMFERAGISIEIPQYSEDWREINVWIVASRQENTITDYHDYLHRHPDIVVPQRTSRAALVENANTLADSLSASAAESAVKSNQRVYDERRHSRDMCR